MESNTAEKTPDLLQGAQHVGKCWAATRGQNVIGTISMRVPDDVDFDVYREKAMELLKLLGDVKAGDIYEIGSDQYFIARPNKHQNRNKNKPKTEIKPIKLFKPQNEKSEPEA